MSPDYENYLSPFSWRYGSSAMRKIWSETNKRQLWRLLWVTLAEAQAEFGLVNSEQLVDLRANIDHVDVPRALDIEAETQHDLMAELLVFAEQAPIGKPILHLGATSTDIEDNADVLRIRQSLNLILDQLRELLLNLVEKIETWADTPIIAFTHLQPAEPTTLGYRFGIYAQDLLQDLQNLHSLHQHLRGKGFKGAVGSSAAYAELIGVKNLPYFEQRLSDLLDLPFYEITTQVYPRKQDLETANTLAGLGCSLHKFAFDLRILQSPEIGEWSEPFSNKQVGSSAMPFKRNPIQAEKIDSLARLLAQMPRLAWDNAAHSLLERTLDDSANRRQMLPEMFLIADELLQVSQKLVAGLRIDQVALSRNLQRYGVFASVERILMASVRAGADRQEMHERLRLHCLDAWEAVRQGNPNPLEGIIATDDKIMQYLPKNEMVNLMKIDTHLGNAPERCRRLASKIKETISFG